MTQTTQQALRAALYRLLRPLVRVMLRHGMAYGSFAELSRKAFVDESRSLLRLSGKKATISGVAAMSGLTRKEASRLVNSDVENDDSSRQRYNRAVRVVTAWSVDPRFQTSADEPRILPPEGDDSFATLVRDYSGDTTPAAMLATLEAGGTVRRTEDGIELLDRAYLPTRTPAASLGIVGTDVAELLTTMDHNLSHPSGQRVFQRKVSNTALRADRIQEFRALAKEESQRLLEDYDAWLTDNQSSGPGDEAGLGHYVSVGIYYFDDTLHEEFPS